ncbi:hypothetical protein [Escherichia coli]|uniref:Uncharacterized protein n=1 Tax=Escherichia phage 121Q TaxID=1555202 RepID=A0A097EXU4_9CAUD|nr:hypothetical protein PBI_121Q_331 [Escherichia phage 121Q]MDI1143618.1 hypothetical protein [Escherichia coli]MED6536261.1 hypothetical protein [Escherichia coli O157]AIT14221.1 hypothetical protein PBI_121Q_331 [Escherichia phage 121Q]MED6562251.1 hypothetical protein [Escherichia coli O157]MED6572975.1 hypothetical protein [Escherichia coli O157]
MKMINLSKDEYNERRAKISTKRTEIYYSEEIKHDKKMIMIRELIMGAMLGTNYQEQEVQLVLNELLMEIRGKLYFHQMTRPLRCTRND